MHPATNPVLPGTGTRFASNRFRRAAHLGAMCCFLLAAALIPRAAHATHGMGSDLSYVNVAPNMYVVTFRFYRDCSGIPADSLVDLNYSAGTCHVGGNMVLNKTSILNGTPFCPDSANSVCQVTLMNTHVYNYQEHIFQGLLTLPAACADWALGVSINVRPETRSLVGMDPLYSELHLNNLNGVVDASPVFGNIPIPQVPVSNFFLYSQNVVDPDGDSLTFHLVPGLSGPGQQVQYETGLSYQQPIRSSIPLVLDTVTGAIGFTPSIYDFTPSEDGDNKYTLVTRVDSWRTVNGQPTRVGSVRRDILVMVVPCQPGTNPPNPPRMMFGGSASAVTELIVGANQPLSLDFSGSDLNLTNTVTLTSNAEQALPGSTFTAQPGNPGLGTLQWTPEAGQIRARPYFFSITATDDGCPVVMRTTQTFALRVSNGVTGAPVPTATVAPVGYPNPFTASVELQVVPTPTARLLSITDALGRVVTTMIVPANTPSVTWHPAANLPSGHYAARCAESKALTLVKL